MKFHRTWRHVQCPVMRWYKLQPQSSTRFQCIEHRRNKEGPFFHEFLILRLTDGSVCRVERTGEGSRADAVRQIGCTANDLVQGASADNRSKLVSDNLSNLIAGVELGQAFDVLDVLAVCHSIQQTKACNVYTLQRYNCYFFCCTILSVLSRRVAEWETIITADIWDSLLTATLDELSKLPPEESEKNLLLRSRTLLDPGNLQPAHFIFQVLRNCLGSQFATQVSVNKALGNTLWHTVWSSALRDGLEAQVYVAALESLKGEGTCAARFRSAIQKSEEEMRKEVVSYGLVELVYAQELSKSAWRIIGKCLDDYVDRRRMIEIEHPIPFGRRVLRVALAPVAGVAVAASPSSVLKRDGEGSERDKLLFFDMRVRLAFARIVAVTGLDLLFDSGNRYDEASDGYFEMDNNQVLPRVLTALRSKRMAGPPKIVAALHQCLNLNIFTEWLTSLVAGPLCHSPPGVLVGQKHFYVRVAHQIGSDRVANETLTATQFQDRIRQRIQAHAQRVAVHQLAAAPLVVQDIENTISEVWKTMPLGFGCTIQAAEFSNHSNESTDDLVPR